MPTCTSANLATATAHHGAVAALLTCNAAGSQIDDVSDRPVQTALLNAYTGPDSLHCCPCAQWWMPPAHVAPQPSMACVNPACAINDRYSSASICCQQHRQGWLQSGHMAVQACQGCVAEVRTAMPHSTHHCSCCSGCDQPWPAPQACPTTTG